MGRARWRGLTSPASLTVPKSKSHDRRDQRAADVVTGKLDVRAAAARLPAETAEPEAAEDAADPDDNDTDLDDEGAANE